MTDKNLSMLNRRDVLLAGAALLTTPAVMTRPAFAITPAEIKSKGKVVIGIQGDNPPWGFVNSSGKHQGLDADIGELYGKYLGASMCCLLQWRCFRIARRLYNTASLMSQT